MTRYTTQILEKSVQNFSMYFRLENDIPVIGNKNLRYIHGDGIAYTVSQFGCAYIPVIQNNEQEFEKWIETVGYYCNDIVAIDDWTRYSSALTYYPDNEELLIFYNNSDRVCQIDFVNSVPACKMENEEDLNFFDDLWVEVFNPYSINPYYKKHISDSTNFDPSDLGRYKSARDNTKYSHKLMPRHPINTKDNLYKDNVRGMFCPINEHCRLKKLTKYEVDQQDVVLGTIRSNLTSSHNQKILLGKNQILILDQLLTQVKLVENDPDSIKIHPVWYKTKLRKHFNYSI